MDHIGRSVKYFAAGLGIGVTVALLTAPQSGEETREWIANKANKQYKFLCRKGQRSIEHLQDAVAAGGEKVSKILKTSKNALSSVSAILA